ncbi:MAG TPA: YdiU family protein [Steroidobacteraceae bacterium]|nr:YdiU family protein [Steroidobacteraceae bacterium]
MRLGLQHSYAALPSRFYARVAPTPVPDPKLVVLNTRLAEELGLDPHALEPEAAAMLAGNRLPEDADPIAMAYAGHQFGGFVPSLGDGRAILLGELRGRDGMLRDIQLKGAGLTRFSRNGDGRAALGPMLREYLISEAMHALGIATTRSLAVVTTGEQVYRESALPGAVLTRVAASHVRVGTFQYFAARGDHDAVRSLLEYVIARHYPQARAAGNPALALLKSVAQRQSALIADWMRVGFIHGVMNTDNMAISGETIDYGPCAFMDVYDANTVFSSIDARGRYAFGNQPVIAQWNLARLAETLLPLIDPDPAKAVELATGTIGTFLAEFDDRFLAGMRRKIGLSAATEGDAELIRRLLTMMQHGRADFTLAFRRLALAAEKPDEEPRLLELFTETGEIASWVREWRTLMARDPEPLDRRVAAMRSANPAVIPRNHRVQAALDAAETGDYDPFHRLIDVLQRPFDARLESSEYALPPRPGERVLQTFCGT